MFRMKTHPRRLDGTFGADVVPSGGSYTAPGVYPAGSLPPSNYPGKQHLVLQQQGLAALPTKTLFVDGSWASNGTWGPYGGPGSSQYSVLTYCGLVPGDYRWNFNNNCRTIEQITATNQALIEDMGCSKYTAPDGIQYCGATNYTNYRQWGSDPRFKCPPGGQVPDATGICKCPTGQVLQPGTTNCRASGTVTSKHCIPKQKSGVGGDFNGSCITQADGNCAPVPADQISLVNQFGVAEMAIPIWNPAFPGRYLEPSKILTGVWVPAVLSMGPRSPNSKECALIEQRRQELGNDYWDQLGSTDIYRFDLGGIHYVAFYLPDNDFTRNFYKDFPWLIDTIAIQPWKEGWDQVWDVLGSLFSSFFCTPVLKDIVRLGASAVGGTAGTFGYAVAQAVSGCGSSGGQGGSANPNNCPLTETAIADNKTCVCLKRAYEYDPDTRTCKKKPDILPWVVGGVLGVGAIAALLAVKSRKAE